MLQFLKLMNLDNLVVISGKPGVFKMLANKNSGMIAQNLDSQKKGFFSTRSHQFTPLASITIYTTDEKGGIELSDVFEKMQETDIPDAKSSSDDLRAYFLEVLPIHDQGQVHISDIKKIIKWFKFLNERDLLIADEPTEEETEGKEVAEETKVEE